MTGTWKSFTLAERLQVLQAFDARCTLDSLRCPPEAQATSATRVGFSKLYALAMDPEREIGEEMREALAADPKLRKDLHRLLSKAALYRLPPMAAASSGPIAERKGEGFAITLHPSRAEPSQVYVLIELEETRRDTPEMLFICAGGGCYFKLALPEAQGRRIQVLAEMESDLVRALQNAESEVFLR